MDKERYNQLLVFIKEKDGFSVSMAAALLGLTRQGLYKALQAKQMRAGLHTALVKAGIPPRLLPPVKTKVDTL